MLTFLPAGFLGLMVGGLIAASSSTILTHLNWGASYLVHDFYRRFLKPDADERHYVRAGRIATVILFFGSSGMVFLLESAKDAFDIILQIGAGTGLLYLVRWFWWRVTAWCEIVAMISSFGVSVLFLLLKKSGVEFGTSQQLIMTIACTTICWLLMAYLGPETDRATLIAFYKKVHPTGPGWRSIRDEVGPIAVEADNMPGALLGWISGCIMIWSALFTVGNFLYGRMEYAAGLAVVFAVSGVTVVRVVQKIWK
jgi:hypothetical protein